MNDTHSIAVICTPNRQARIPHNTIDFIIEQTLKPQQWIIVYEESEAENIAGLQDRIKEITPASQLECITHDANTSFIAARNRALDCVKHCQYIHFVNSDIKLPEDFYEKAVQSLVALPNRAATVPMQLKLTNCVETEIDFSSLVDNPWLWLMRSELEIGSTVFLRSIAVEKAGKFNPVLSLGADTDFFARISNQGAWHCVSDCVVSQTSSKTQADLQLQFPDYYRQWALVYENLLDTYGARKHIPRNIYRSILAKVWCQAGQDLLTHQRIEEARDCFTRSLSWQLFNPSLRYLMKISRLRKKARF